MQYLKQSTAGQLVLLGQALNDTDFNTPETGLTINASDIFLWKNQSTSAVNPPHQNSAASNLGNGYYNVTLDATDTNTAGQLRVYTHVAGALVLQAECMVLPASIYNFFVLGSVLGVNVTEMDGDTFVPSVIKDLYNSGIIASTVQSSPAPTSTTFNGGMTGSSFPDNCFKDKAVIWTSGNNVGLRDCVVSASVSSTGVITVKAAFPFTPLSGDAFQLVGVAG